MNKYVSDVVLAVYKKNLNIKWGKSCKCEHRLTNVEIRKIIIFLTNFHI